MANLIGTSNQVNVANGTGVLVGGTNATLSTPQDIHSGASPTFAGLTLNDNAAIGGSIYDSYILWLTGSITTGVSQTGLVIENTGSTAATGSVLAARFKPATAAGTFTCGQMIGVQIDDGSKGANSIITTQYGLLIDNMTVGSTNYAIYTNTGAVRFGGAVTCASTLTVTSSITATAGITSNSGVGISYANPDTDLIPLFRTRV